MKCKVCGNDATMMIAKKTRIDGISDGSTIVEIYEFRCNDHKNVER